LRFPHDLPGEAVVRCPLCTEQFAFSEMAAALPPMLEVISLPESEGEFEDRLEGINRLDDLLAAKPAAGASLVVPKATPLVTTGASSRSHRRPAESPWRPLILLIEIALSGVVGIALAVLVLWWLPGQWHRDPLALKPVAAKYAPWLLPPAHRPLTELAPIADASPPRQSTAAKGKSTSPPVSQKSTRISQNTNDEPPATEPELTEQRLRSDSVVPASAVRADDPQEQAKPPQTNPAAQPKPKEETLEDHWSKLDDETPEPPELMWTGSPEISNLVRLADLRRTEPPKPHPVFPELTEPDFVGTFRELARVAGQASAEDVGLEAARAKLNAWLATVTVDEWRKGCESTARDLEKSSIAPRGVIYLARLKTALAEGSWLHLELEPFPGEPTFPILIDPQSFHSAGGEALLGKEIYVLASELPDPKRLVADVPASVKKTWLVGAIHQADSAAPTKPLEKAAF
jgi:hypothetical protein